MTKQRRTALACTDAKGPLVSNDDLEKGEQGFRDEATEAQNLVYNFVHARSLRMRWYQTQSHLTFMAFIYRLPWCALIDLCRIERDLHWVEEAENSRLAGEDPVSWEINEKKHENRGRKIPFLVVPFVIFIAVIHVVDLGLNDWNTTPYDSRIVLDFGYFSGKKVFQGHKWYRFLTSACLHGSVFLLSVNSIAILQYGLTLEYRYGTTKAAWFGLMAFLAHVGALICSGILFPCAQIIGSSCISFGLRGVAVSDAFLNWDVLAMRKTTERSPHADFYMTATMLLFFLYDIFSGMVEGLFLEGARFKLSDAAHMIALVIGFCFGLPFMKHIKSSHPRIFTEPVGTFNGGVLGSRVLCLSIILLAGALLFLLKMQNTFVCPV